MMIGKLRRSMREDEAGQALVLGALVMLVLAMSVFVTVQLGHAIHERMRVQDAADNVAFSSAAAVARSYNFMAWVNRTMITQYVSAMAVQGVVAMLDGAEVWSGMMGDTMQTLASIVCSTKKGGDEEAEALQRGLEAGAKMARGVTQGFRRASQGVDAVAGQAGRFVSLLNYWGMYGAQWLMQKSTQRVLASEHLGNLQARMIEHLAGAHANTNAIGAVYKQAMAVENANAYVNSFDPDSCRLPEGGTWPQGVDWNDGQQRAERLMAEITNASRTGPAEMELTWETNSGVEGTSLFDRNAAGPDFADKVFGAISGKVKGSSRLTAPMDEKRFTEEGGGPNFIWSAGALEANDNSFMTRGTAMSSAAHVKGGLNFVGLMAGSGEPRVVGIQAAHDAGSRLHCRYDGATVVEVKGCPDAYFTKPMKCQNEAAHDFWGMTRYISFRPIEDPPFGQTDFVGMVNKGSEQARFAIRALGFGGGTLRTGRVGSQSWAAASDTFEGSDPGQEVMAGLNGWARAQCYYHRPGYWAEPPNFFNPYWKARLAPVSPLVTKFTDQLSLDGPIKDLIEKAITH